MVVMIQLVASLRKPVVDAFKDTFRSAIVPAFEAAAQTMLQQLSSVLQVTLHTTPRHQPFTTPGLTLFGLCGCYSVAWKRERSARQQRQRG